MPFGSNVAPLGRDKSAEAPVGCHLTLGEAIPLDAKAFALWTLMFGGRQFALEGGWSGREEADA